jgi:hypothetical protein
MIVKLLLIAYFDSIICIFLILVYDCRWWFAVCQIKNMQVVNIYHSKASFAPVSLVYYKIIIQKFYWTT